MRKALLGVVLCALAGAPWLVPGQQMQPDSYSPPNGFVPDSITAERIAMAVWIPIYGESQIRGEAPYHARLRHSIWTVEGSLPSGHVGGVAVAEIAKRDGRILRVSHGK